MSRKLNVKQKKLIEAEYNRVRANSGKTYVKETDMDSDTLDKIDSINCNEMFWQNMCRFIDDLNNKVMQKIQSKW